MEKPSTIKIIILVIISILLTSAIGFTGYYYINYSLNAGNKTVIDFSDMSKEEIKQYLIDNSIKEEYVIFEEAFDEEVEEGKVISQSILAEQGKFKDVVTIIISKGYDPDLEVELPDITNLMQADIEKWFDDNHFSNVTYEFIVPEDAEESMPYGLVIGLSKVGLAKRSDSINVLLADEIEITTTTPDNNDNSTSKEDDYVTIPDFKGYTVEQFADWTHSRGLKYYVYEKYSDTYKKGEVMSQSPASGGKAKKGSTVTLTMSLGQSKKMDNLVGKIEADAKKYAEENGLKIKVLEDYSRTIEKGKIISTSPKSGDKYSEGDTLTITVSKGSDVIKLDGSYVDKTENELKKAVTSKYASAKFSKSETYSDKAANTVVSHDSEISLINNFKYTMSLGQYSDSNNYAGKYLTDVQSVANAANAKGAGVSVESANYETTRDSSLNNKIKSCTFANKKYSCTVYRYEEATSTFVASDFAGYQAGSHNYTKDGNSYSITVKVEYTGYNNQEKDSFNSASCSTGNIIKNGSVVTVVLNKGPEPISYGSEIVSMTYKSLQIPDDASNPTYDKVKDKVIEVLTGTSYGYISSQIECIPTDSKQVGYIDIDNSSKGTFAKGKDTIRVYIGSASRGE